MLVTNLLERLCLPMENPLCREPGRSWAMSDTPNTSGVERKSAYPDVTLTEHSERRIREPLGPDSFQTRGDTGGSKNMSKRKAVRERGTRL